jgi:tetratricopeptide (TPR) repeat protein
MEVKRVNKILYLIATFPFGLLGVNNFIRGRVGTGIFKILTAGGFLGIWPLFEFISALTMLSEYKNDFIFINGFYCDKCKKFNSWECSSCGKGGNYGNTCRECYQDCNSMSCSCGKNKYFEYVKGEWGPSDREIVVNGRNIYEANADLCIGFAVSCAKQGDFDRAFVELGIARQLNPHDVNVCCAYGITYFLQGEHYGWAISKFDDAIKLNPDFADAYKYRGMAYSARGSSKQDYDQAIKDFETALRLNPKDSDDIKEKLEITRKLL